MDFPNCHSFECAQKACVNNWPCRCMTSQKWVRQVQVKSFRDVGKSNLTIKLWRVALSKSNMKLMWWEHWTSLHKSGCSNNMVTHTVHFHYVKKYVDKAIEQIRKLRYKGLDSTSQLALINSKAWVELSWIRLQTTLCNINPLTLSDQMWSCCWHCTVHKSRMKINLM